ncbi:hypothetical protein Hte_002268 [Hypoxylon texense]
MAGGFPNQAGIASAETRPTLQQTVLISEKGDPPRVISNLFYGTVELWLLTLRKQSWPFLFNPAPPKTTESENSPGQNPTAAGLCEMEPRSNRAKEPSVSGTISSPEGLEPSDAKDEQNYWCEARLQLGEKHDQLCLWKAGFSDRDLDSLLESESFIRRRLGKIILEALLGLAVSMSVAVDLHKTSEQTAVNNDKPTLQRSAHKLNKFIEDARKITGDNYDEDDPMLDGTTKFATMTQLLAELQSGIAILSTFGGQLKLATAR